ncbi:hypothetical protein E2542_SST16736 [Spatholobus suberectus]|nr:hypothetical protein E2542_SST16736 [Spatholobus suberectus]
MAKQIELLSSRIAIMLYASRHHASQWCCVNLTSQQCRYEKTIGDTRTQMSEKLSLRMAPVSRTRSIGKVAAHFVRVARPVPEEPFVGPATLTKCAATFPVDPLGSTGAILNGSFSNI